VTPLCTVQDGLKKYITDALRKSEQKLQERGRYAFAAKA